MRGFWLNFACAIELLICVAFYLTSCSAEDCFVGSIVSSTNHKIILHQQQLQIKSCPPLVSTVSYESLPSTVLPSTELPDLFTELDALDEADLPTVSQTTPPSCQIFKYPTNSPSKVKFQSTWTANFSCVSDSSLCGSQSPVVVNGQNGAMFCCSGAKCNSLLFLHKESKADFEKVGSCYQNVTEDVITQTPCTSASMCLNITVKGGSTNYLCGNDHLEKIRCQQDHMFGEGCYKINNTHTSCCCAADNCNKELESSRTTVQSTPVAPHKDDNKPTSASVPILIASLSIGILFAVIIFILVKRKWRTRSRGLSVMDFGYNRIQADSYEDDY